VDVADGLIDRLTASLKNPLRGSDDPAGPLIRDRNQEIQDRIRDYSSCIIR